MKVDFKAIDNRKEFWMIGKGNCFMIPGQKEPTLYMVVEHIENGFTNWGVNLHNGKLKLFEANEYVIPVKTLISCEYNQF